MEYTQEMVNDQNLKIMTVTDFLSTYHPDLTPPTIRYNIHHNNIDYMKLGKGHVIVLTLQTLNYKPAPHPKRYKK